MSRMRRDDSIVLPVDCRDEQCGMISAYRFFNDGSFRKILDACVHMKRLPDRQKIVAEFRASKLPHAIT